MLKKLFSLVTVFAIALFARAEIVQDAYVDYATMDAYNFWKGGTPEGATFGIEDGALTIVNPTAKNNWEFQYFVADGMNLTVGQIYDVEIALSGSVAGLGNLVFGSWGVGVDNDFVIPAGEGTYKTKVACPTDEVIHICLQTGSYVGTLKIKSVKVSHDTECSPELNALKANNIEPKSNPWDNQVYIKLATPLEQGKEYTISVDLYGDADGKIPIWGDGKKTGEESNSTQYGVGWGDYIVTAGKWTTTKRSFTADNNLEQLNFCFGSADQYTGTYLFFDNVVLTEKGSDVNLLSNGDFTNGAISPWGKPGYHTFTLKVETAPVHPEPEPMHPNTVWVGPKKMNWGDGVELSKELFANVRAGDILIAKYDTAGDGTFQTIFGGWSGLNIPTYEFGNYDFAANDGNGTVTFTLPESFSAFATTVNDEPATLNVFNMIKEKGIVFQGTATLNSVIYIPNPDPIVEPDPEDPYTYKVGQDVVFNHKYYTVAGENIVANYNFADGTYNGWVSTNAGNPVDATAWEISKDGLHGANFLHNTGKLSGGSDKPNNIRHAWDLEAGKTYLASYWTKGSNSNVRFWNSSLEGVVTPANELALLVGYNSNENWVQNSTVFQATEEAHKALLNSAWCGSGFGVTYIEIVPLVEKEVELTDIVPNTYYNLQIIDTDLYLSAGWQDDKQQVNTLSLGAPEFEQAFKFVPVEGKEGVYNIIGLDGKALVADGDWNFFWNGAPTEANLGSADYQFSVVPELGYIQIKTKNNYVGSDGIKEWSKLYTDKGDDKAVHFVPVKYEVPVVEEHFYVTGDFGENSWNPELAAELVKGEDGLYTYTAAQASAIKVSKAQGDWDAFNGALVSPANYSGAAITAGEWMDYVTTEAYDGNIVMPWKGDWTISINPDESKMQFTTTTPEPQPITVYYNNVVTNWDEVYVYMWNANNDNNGDWPGNKMTKGEGTIWSYSFTGFEPAKVIFNNGNGQKTPDLDFEADKTYGDTAVELYLRGDMNNWGTDAKFETADNVIYTMTGVSIEAGQEFKIATSAWNLAYGYSEPIALGVEYTLAADGGNMTLAEAMVNGSITFDYSTGKATFTQGTAPVPTVTVTDAISVETTGTSNFSGTGYADIKNCAYVSAAEYNVYAANNKNELQINNNSKGYGIASTKSGGIVKSVTVTFGSANSTTNILEVYGKNTAYTGAPDLQNTTTAGTLVNEMTAGKGVVATYTFTDDYTYVGFHSKKGAIYIEKIDVVWETEAGEVVIAAPEFSPAAGMVKAGTEVTLTTQTEGAEIYYTTDESEPTEASTKYTAPIAINDYTVIKAVAVAYGISSKVVTAEYMVMPAIEDLSPIMDFEQDTPFTVNCDLTVVYANGANVYVYDGSNYALVYKSNLGLEAGDVIAAGWDAKISIYNGLVEIVPTSELAKSEAQPKVANPMPVDAEDVEYTLAAYNVNRYFTLNGVVFDEATPATRANFTGKMGETEVTFRNNFTIASVEAGTYNVTGFVGVFNSTVQFFPISYDVPAIVCDNIAALADLTEEQAENVTLNLTDAKVTYFTGELYFVEDATAAMQLGVTDADFKNVAVEGLAQGKKISGKMVGFYFEGMFMTYDTDITITSSEDVDVTTGATMTLAEALEPENANKLVTFVASETLTIVDAEGEMMITEGETSMLATDVFYSLPNDYVYPAAAKQITGVLYDFGMPVLALRSEADIVAAEVVEEHFYITGDFGNQWSPAEAAEFVKDEDGNYAYTAAEATVFKISKNQGLWNVFNTTLVYPVNYNGERIAAGEWMAYEVVDAQDWDYEGYSDNIVMPWKGDWTITINPAEGKMQFTTTTPEPVDIKTVYYNNVVTQWETVYAYLWNADNTHYVAWPGEAMTKGEGDVWSYEIKNFDPAKIIFNNGGNGQQTDDLDFEADKTYGDTAVELYLRGAMNNWGTTDKFETEDYVIYTMTGVNIEAGQEFKIANSAWNIAYGYNQPIALGVEYTLTTDGGNMKLAETMYNGSITFDYSTGKATFTQGQKPVTVCDNIADLAALTEEQAENVQLNLTGAKVTYYAAGVSTYFVEDATGAMKLQLFDENYEPATVEGIAQGKAITGSLTGMYMEGQFMAANADITASVDADVTTGTEMTLAQAKQAANANKLVTFVASDDLTITRDEDALIIAQGDDEMLVMDVYYSFPEGYEFPEEAKQVTGILINMGMSLVMPRDPADIVPADPKPVEYTVYFDNSASQWETVYAYVWNADGNYKAWPGEEMTQGEADVWSYTVVDFEAANIIFSNGNGQQTEDLVFEAGKTYVGEAPAPSTELYLRGSINDWGTSMKFETEDEVNYTLVVNDVIPAGAEFKIANADWTVSYTYEDSAIEPNVEYTFVNGNGGPGNAKIAEEIAAGAKITFNATTGAFMIAGTTVIDAIDAEDGAEYYNMQGIRLNAPTIGKPCIRVLNGTATKVIVK